MSLYFKSEFGKAEMNGESLGFGNSEIVTMVDWMGSRDQSSANLFIVAGIVFPGSDNGIGHDRNDQILGIVTQKTLVCCRQRHSFTHFLGNQREPHFPHMTKLKSNLIMHFLR